VDLLRRAARRHVAEIDRGEPSVLEQGDDVCFGVGVRRQRARVPIGALLIPLAVLRLEESYGVRGTGDLP
jgi:hypothetical protein